MSLLPLNYQFAPHTAPGDEPGAALPVEGLWYVAAETARPLHGPSNPTLATPHYILGGPLPVRRTSDPRSAP